MSTTIMHLNTVSAASKLPVQLAVGKKGSATGCVTCAVSRLGTGAPFLIQFNHMGPGAPFPPWAFSQADGKRDALTMNITDPTVKRGLETLSDHLREMFIEQATTLLGQKKSPELMRATFNPILTPGREKRDDPSACWPDTLKVKLDTKYQAGNPDFPIVDALNIPVDPTTLHGRGCLRAILQVTFLYAAGKAYGVSCKLVKMTVTNNAKDERYDFIDCPDPVATPPPQPSAPSVLENPSPPKRRRVDALCEDGDTSPR